MKKNSFLKLLVVGMLFFIVFGSGNVAFATNKMDIMYNDGTVEPFDNLSEYAKTIPKETLPSEGIDLNKKSVYGIIGKDDREVVDNPLIMPYKSIVQIYVAFPGGKTNATGFLISPDTVLTSAHCLYNRSLGGWAKSVSVNPVLSEEIKASSFMVPRAYIEEAGIIEHDIGAIKLPENMGEKYGWFGLTPELSPTITLSGYHGDQFWEMKTQTGGIKSFSESTISYELDILKGSSGSPLYNDKNQVLAINGYLGSNLNTGIRTNKEHYTLAYYWGFNNQHPIREVKIIDPPKQLEINESNKLSYQIIPENGIGEKMIWKSSNEKVATISETGVVTAKTPGETLISIATKDGRIKAECNISVSSTMSGVYGTVPWSWNGETQQLTFKSGEFPNTQNRKNSIESGIGNQFKGQYIKKIVFSEPVTANVNSSHLFASLSNLEKIENLNNLDTSRVNNMQDMFSGNFNLKELDLSSFDTSKVTNMTAMFSMDKKLEKLNLSNINTKNVTDMSYMFVQTISLNDINLSSFDTSKVTKMSNMFYGMASLKRLNLSNFDTSKVTALQGMFSNTENLEELNLSSFNTSRVTDMSSMFCRTGLASLDLRNFNTREVTNMSHMFSFSPNLKTLDLSSFDTRKEIYSGTFMFYNSYALEEIKLGALSKFPNNPRLPEKIDTPFSGRWIGVDSKVSYKSSDEFAKSYDGSKPGTYIREKIR